MLENRVYAWLCRKVRGREGGRIQTKPTVAKLRTDISEDPIEIRKALMALRLEGKIEYSAGSHGEPISAFIRVFPPKVEVPAHVTAWRGVLEACRLPQEDRLALEPLGSALYGFAMSDLECLLAGLVRLRDEQAQVHGQSDFNVSAAYLMGSSKLLSALDSRALQAFGIEVNRFTVRPSYIVVGGNTRSPQSVILIENPVPFETAVVCEAAEHHLFVCTFGFGLSAAGNDYGNQLAGAVETGKAYVLNRSRGTPPRLNEILEHPNIHFWGDLDVAGMQIFKRLAAKVSHIKLSALYQPMINAIEREGNRHPYVAAVGKDGQARMAVQASQDDVQSMLTLCRQFAVDQEIVAADEIVQHAGRALMHCSYGACASET